MKNVRRNRRGLRGLLVALLSIAMIAAFDVPRATARGMNLFPAIIGGMIAGAIIHGARRPAYGRSYGRAHRHAAPPHAASRSHRTGRTVAGRGKPKTAPQQLAPEPTNLKIAPPSNGNPTATSPAGASPSLPGPPISVPGPLPVNAPSSPAPVAAPPSVSGPSQIARPSPSPSPPMPAPKAQTPRANSAPDEIKPKDD
jgi:hypothetical protein